MYYNARRVKIFFSTDENIDQYWCMKFDLSSGFCILTV